MATAKSPLEFLLDFCELDKDKIEYVKKTLYKYKDDPVVKLVCGVINENAPQANRFMELIDGVNSGIGFPNTYPLIIPSPNSHTELRVYPNILLDSHSNLETVSTSFCASHLKTFLTAYDTDMEGEKSKQKWVPQERAEKRILEFVDMPTARALQRYVFSTGQLKDHQIRDFGEAIDNNRKPLELIFTEKPEDYTIMYGSGPHSCMAESAAEKQHWEFMKEEGLCPTSWYHYCEYTTGVYALKNNKVCARTILFKGPADKNWGWVRIYADNPEIHKKFQSALADQGILQCTKAVIPPEYSFRIPSIRKGTVFAAPWPYIDSPIPSPHSNGQSWNVQFDKETKEFIYHFNNPKYDKVNGRSGHIISSDYVTMECTCCGKVIKKNEALNVRIEHDYHVFCSDSCAFLEGFIKVMEGTGNAVFKKDSEEFIPVLGNSMYKFSTLKAAVDNGYNPVISEPGIFPEDTDIKVSQMGVAINNIDGVRHMIETTGLEAPSELKTSSKIPFKLSNDKRVVVFDEEKVYIAA